MPTLADTLTQATANLAAVTETPRLEAEILLAHALDLSRAQLCARLKENIEVGDFDRYIARRQQHEPIAYITGHTEFFSLDFIVRPPILIPRPETEHLVEYALENLPNHKPARILDCCTGTGCVAIAIAHNASQAAVTATDINPDAIALATENARTLDVPIQFYQGDLFDALPPKNSPFDLIVANPPYVEEAAWTTLDPTIRLYEDARALRAGHDGLDIIRRIVDQAPKHLATGGHLALEIGEQHFSPLKRLLHQKGYTNIRFRRDLAGTQRIIVATHSTP